MCCFQENPRRKARRLDRQAAERVKILRLRQTPTAVRRKRKRRNEKRRKSSKRKRRSTRKRTTKKSKAKRKKFHPHCQSWGGRFFDKWRQLVVRSAKNKFLLFSEKEETEEKKEEFFSTVRPEEIPDVPSNKFLSRDPPPAKEQPERRYVLYALFCSQHLVRMALLYFIEAILASEKKNFLAI